MDEQKWTVINKDREIAFVFPCRGNFFYESTLKANIGCTKPNGGHGHIELRGFQKVYAFIPICCYSQAGVKAAVECLKLEKSGFIGILDLPEVKRLPAELTEEEKLVVASSVEMDKLAKLHGFWNLKRFRS